MSGGAYPCNIDCGKRQQLEKRIADLKEQLQICKLIKDSKIQEVAELEAKLEKPE